MCIKWYSSLFTSPRDLSACAHFTCIMVGGFCAVHIYMGASRQCESTPAYTTVECSIAYTMVHHTSSQCLSDTLYVSQTVARMLLACDIAIPIIIIPC